VAETDPGQRKVTVLKTAMSIVAVAAIVSRLIWPWLKLDAITLGLLVVAAIPWLSGLFDSLEFPGGWKLVYRKLQTVGEKIPGPPAAPTEGGNVAASGDVETPSYLTVQNLDPQLALVGLRIEIEQRLQRLAADNNVSLPGRHQSPSRLTRELGQIGVLPGEVAGALQEVLQAANAAAHGATLPANLQDFAFVEGPRILAFLDSLEAQRGLQPPN
jgi:hypothetical protein